VELLGLPLSQLLTVLGIAGGAVVLLYFLKLRRREVAVPFVRLWDKLLRDEQTTRLFARLKRLLSLLLALVIVASVVLALGDPRWAGASRRGRTIVVLIDASASMQATDVRPSRLEEAKRRARGLLEQLGPQDRAIVAQMDASTVPLSPVTRDVRVLRDAVGRVRGTDVAASLPRALAFARDVLAREAEPEVVVISDGKLGDVSHESLGRLRVSWVKIGTGARNVGITAFAVRRYVLDKSHGEVLVTLHDFGPRDEEVELSLLGDGHAVDVQTLTVRHGQSVTRLLPDVGGVDRTLEARIRLKDGTHDALPADDRAYARLPPRRRARVLSVSRGNLYLSAALLLDEYLDVTEIPPAAYPPAERYDVTIFDDFVPATPPETAAIYLHPAAPEGTAFPFAVTGTIPRPSFSHVDRQDPLVRAMALADVNVADALDVTLEPGDRAIASDPRGALVVQGRRHGQPFVALTFDVRRSDLPLRVAWPLFLLHAVDGFTSADASYLGSYRTGETWRMPVPEGATRATLRGPLPGPETRELAIEDGRAVFDGQRAGFYTLAAGGSEDTIAASLGSADEGDVAPARRLVVGGHAAGTPRAGRAGLREELWLYLVVAALALVALEWLTWHRRWTV
jgi:hypothetical protein